MLSLPVRETPIYIVFVVPPDTEEGSKTTKQIPLPLVVVVTPFQASDHELPPSVLFHRPLALVPQNRILLLFGSTASLSPFPRPYPFPFALNIEETSTTVKEFPLSVDLRIAVAPSLM